MALGATLSVGTWQLNRQLKSSGRAKAIHEITRSKVKIVVFPVLLSVVSWIVIEFSAAH